MASDLFDNDLFGEDVIAQTECFGVEVEVSFSNLIITGLALFPSDVLHARHGLAIPGLANVIVGWHIGPHVTAIWLRWVAIVAR